MLTLVADARCEWSVTVQHTCKQNKKESFEKYIKPQNRLPWKPHFYSEISSSTEILTEEGTQEIEKRKQKGRKY